MAHALPQGADTKPNAEAATVVMLERPVQFGSETITQLVLQPITGKAMRYVALPASREVPPHYYLELASAVSGQPPAVFDLLAAQDVLRVVQAVATMVDPSAGTTAKDLPPLA